MILKTQRFRQRQDQLLFALHPKKMQAIWIRHVRGFLRNQPIQDLHDYYEFHLNLKNRIGAIREKIIEGIYQPSRPLRIRSEKKHGISRQLVILNPDDAVVLETLGEYLFPIIKKAQPSINAFYSRNQPGTKTPADFDEYVGYPWWILWPIFQKRIFNFASQNKLIVIGDVATYYDGIDFVQLRNFLSSLGHFSEILLDFLFFVLERFVWRPDYLPFPGKGLPQINLDTPRLLAHAFLFEVDSFLETFTNGDFVRWMDDINCGCDNESEAKYLLRTLDDLLLSRGLHLNSSKCSIMNRKEAFEHFQVVENAYLTIFQNRLKRLQDSGLVFSIFDMRKRLRRRFRNFIEKEHKGYWDKVLKRYFNISSDCNDPFLEKYVPNFLLSQPALRSTIFRYYKSIGWSKEREDDIITHILDSVDDDGFFNAIDVLLQWIPVSYIQYIHRMRQLAFKIVSKDQVRFLGALWLLGKFGNEYDIDTLLAKSINVWKNSDWLARQVSALLPRMALKTRNLVYNVSNTFGLTSAKLVLDNYKLISSNNTSFIKKVKPYILAPKKYGYYPLPKLLIALSLLQGNLNISLRDSIKKELLKEVNDPLYRFYIIRGH